ncbi:MAG: arsenate reductase ArsC [Candidatus Eisenbacteria bacterium]|nr:arsenate reductase ArsC [Candidatus Eisenbacteria bacterium]
MWHVLFLCSGNACRSQMAEAWARALASGSIFAESAGTDPQPLDPRAVTVMAEAGIDISRQRSKHVGELADRPFDAVITLCDAAQEQCPVFPGARRMLHAGFDDPPRLATGARSEEEALAPYRRVRDEIRTFIERLPETLATES